MKKIIATLLSAVLVLSMVLALASCGKTEGSKALPIVCGETGMNDICGVATYGVDYYNIGVKAGNVAADILLEGANPATTPVQFDPTPALSINRQVAQEIGFTIPESVASQATGGSGTEVTRVTTAIVSEAEADYVVGVLQLVQHVALDAANKGFVDQLSVRMDAAGKTVYVDNQNAAGENANNVTICSSFVAKEVDLIYTIATSSSQAAAEATAENNIPVVFSSVTEPISAGLVESYEAPGKNVTGVSDMNPVADQIKLIGQLLGKDTVKIGLLYTSAETNSVVQINLAKAACQAEGYQFVDKGIGDINDIQSAFISLRNAGVDAIYIPTDNTLANGAATVHALNIGE